MWRKHQPQRVFMQGERESSRKLVLLLFLLLTIAEEKYARSTENKLSNNKNQLKKQQTITIYAQTTFAVECS